MTRNMAFEHNAAGCKKGIKEIHFIVQESGKSNFLKVKRKLRKAAYRVNPLNSELIPIRHLLALIGARHIVHVSWVRVKRPCSVVS